MIVLLSRRISLRISKICFPRHLIMSRLPKETRRQPETASCKRIPKHLIFPSYKPISSQSGWISVSGCWFAYHAITWRNLHGAISRILPPHSSAIPQDYHRLPEWQADPDVDPKMRTVKTGLLNVSLVRMRRVRDTRARCDASAGCRWLPKIAGVFPARLFHQIQLRSRG